MRKKIVSLVLAFSMVLTWIPAAALAASYEDTDGHWAESSIDRWSEAGVVVGYEDGSFAPNNTIRRSEAADIFATLLRLTEKADISGYTDVPADAWYADSIAKCVKFGILNGTGADTMSPEKPLTREQMFTMIGRALGLTEQESSDRTFADSQEISEYAQGFINAMADMGVLNGVGGDRLAPLENIDRAAVMAVLDRLIGTYAYKDGETCEVSATGFTLVVAQKVELTGEAGSMPIVVTAMDADVDLSSVTGGAEIIVRADNVTIRGADPGTHVVADPDMNTVVNDHVMDAEEDEHTVPEPAKPAPGKPASSGTGGSTNPGPDEPAECTVTFDLNCEDEKAAGKPADQTVMSGAAVEAPREPTRPYYTFEGWYKEAACTNLWNFEKDTVKGDLTLHARWLVNVDAILHEGMELVNGDMARNEKGYGEYAKLTLDGWDAAEQKFSGTVYVDISNHTPTVSDVADDILETLVTKLNDHSDKVTTLTGTSLTRDQREIEDLEDVQIDLTQGDIDTLTVVEFVFNLCPPLTSSLSGQHVTLTIMANTAISYLNGWSFDIVIATKEDDGSSVLHEYTVKFKDSDPRTARVTGIIDGIMGDDPVETVGRMEWAEKGISINIYVDAENRDKTVNEIVTPLLTRLAEQNVLSYDSSIPEASLGKPISEMDHMSFAIVFLLADQGTREFFGYTATYYVADAADGPDDPNGAEP